MQKNLTTKLALAAAVGTLALAGAASAADMFGQTVDVFNTNGPEFISGDGNPIGGFAQDSVAPGLVPANTVSVALRPRSRDIGPMGSPDIISTNRYSVAPGFSSSNPSVTNLVIDYQFDPGVDAVTNYVLRLSLDFNPAVGNTDAADFVVFEMPIFGDANTAGWDGTDGYFTQTTAGAGVFSDTTVPYVISNTTRQDFGFFSTLFGKSYDPNALGEYEYRLEAFLPAVNGVLGAPIADITAFAVVPEPASLGLIGVAGLGLLRRRRGC